ncbi:MAG: methyltransferase domain-containing protein [Gemmatimonadetes bacterium]|nr:methyltransferase domain-containing protein [Gemmatimonadota bacterium]
MTIDRSKFQFTDDLVPRGYDEYLVPPLFRPWAESLVGRLAPPPGGRALDVACGPGTVTRELATAIGETGQVAGIDSSAAMIERARSHPETAGQAPIAYTTGNAVPLPYPDAAFDVVTCQQGLQFFPDAREALGEMRRVLTVDGRCAASVWQPLAECLVFQGYATALTAAGFADLAALLAIPFPHWTASELAARARAAGFGRVAVEAEERELVFSAGIRQAAQALTGTPLAPMLAALDPDERARLDREMSSSLAPLVDPAGAVRAPMRSWFMMASA